MEKTMTVCLCGKNVPINKALYDKAISLIKVYNSDEFENDTAMYFHPKRGTEISEVINSHSVEELTTAAEAALNFRLGLLV